MSHVLNREYAAFIGADQLIKKLVLASQDPPDEHLFVELFGWTLQRNHPLRHRSSPLNRHLLCPTNRPPVEMRLAASPLARPVLRLAGTGQAPSLQAEKTLGSD